MYQLKFDDQRNNIHDQIPTGYIAYRINLTVRLLEVRISSDMFFLIVKGQVVCAEASYILVSILSDRCYLVGIQDIARLSLHLEES